MALHFRILFSMVFIFFGIGATGLILYNLTHDIKSVLEKNDDYFILHLQSHKKIYLCNGAVLAKSTGL